MSRLVYNGAYINSSRSTGYRDTILAPFVGSDGKYELTYIDQGNFYKYFSESNNITWNTVNYLNNLGYDVLTYRHQPWNTDLINYYVSNKKNDSFYHLRLPKIQLNELEYISISVNGKLITFYKPGTELEYIPIIYESTVSYNINEFNSLDELLPIKLIDEEVYIDIDDSFWYFKSANELEFNHSRQYLVSEYTSLSIFNDNPLDAYHTGWVGESGYVSSANIHEVYIVDSLTNNEMKFVNPDESKYQLVVKVGDNVTKDTIIYSRNYIAYPEVGISYKDKTEYTLVNTESESNYLVESVIRAKSYQTGTVIKVTDRAIYIRNPDIYVVYNPNSSIYKPYVDVDDIVEVDQVLFITDRLAILKHNSLVTNSYAQSIDCGSDYKFGDYYLLNLGAYNRLIVFSDVDTLGNFNEVNVDSIIRWTNYNGKPIYIPINYWDGNLSYPRSREDINNQFNGIIQSFGFQSTYDPISNTIYMKRPYVFIQSSISNCMTVGGWEFGSNDIQCRIRENNRMISFYSKYPTSQSNIEVQISRNKIDYIYPEIGYDITVRKYSGSDVVDIESHILDFIDGSPNNYKNFNSNIVTIDVPDNMVNYYYEDRTGNYILIDDNYYLITESNLYIHEGKYYIHDPHGNYIEIGGLYYRLDDYTRYSKLDMEPYKYKILTDGTYRLGRLIEYPLTTSMMIANVNNLYVDETQYEILIDSGYTNILYSYALWNKFLDSNNLMLFNTIDPNDYDFNFGNVKNLPNYFSNASFSFGDVYINGIQYPNYVTWLKESLVSNYTGEVSVESVTNNSPNNFDEFLMRVKSDGYRYLLSHTYIHTYFGIYYPESVLILSRMRNYIYETLDYTKSESEIKSQIESKYNEIMSLCTGVLEYFNIDKVEVDLNKRSVSIHLVFGFNKFRLDPIYLSIEINL